MCLAIMFNSYRYDNTSVKHYVGQSSHAFTHDIAFAQYLVTN